MRASGSGGRVLLRLLKLELRFVRLKEIAEFLRVPQTMKVPLSASERQSGVVLRAVRNDGESATGLWWLGV
jgi:hypothetical protein